MSAEWFNQSMEDTEWFGLVTAVHKGEYEVLYAILTEMDEDQAKKMLVNMTLSLVSLMRSHADEIGMTHDEFLREAALEFASPEET